MKSRKVAVIGLGHVGAHVAYNLAVQGICDDILLLDMNEQKVISECQDLRDSAAYLPHRVHFSVADYPDLTDCDVIVNCVGDIVMLAETMSRIDELKFNIPAVRSFAHKIKESGFNGILINISNPCDVITRELALALDLPKGRVFGTGTGLDTSRLLSALARQTGVDHKSITAYMLGEHGASQYAPWSCVSFAGVPLSQLEKTDERFQFDKEALCKEAIGGGWVTFKGKTCTEYGISATAARMVHQIFHDEKAIMPVSALLEGEYGEKDLFVGVPAIIGKNGVEQVLELPLTSEEQNEFHQCCDDIRKIIGMIDEL